MREFNSQPDFEEFEEDGFGIDFFGIGIKILKHWLPICVIGVLSGAIGVVIALRQPTLWKVTASVAPEVQRANSNLSGIASMLGISNTGSSSGSDALNISLFPQICKSTPFLTSLFDVKVHPNYPDKNGEYTNTVTVFEHMTEQDKPLTRRQQKKKDKAIEEGTYVEPNSTVDNISFLTGWQRMAVGALSKSIEASFDNKTGFSRINITLDDPRIATELADTVLARLQEYVIDYRTRKSTADLEYYTKMAEEARLKMIEAQNAYAASVDYNRGSVMQSVASQRERLRNEASLAQQIYSQMAQQRELLKAKVQEEKPVFAIVQPASMPKEPITSRKKVVIEWGLIGGILACLWFGAGLDICKFLIRTVKERWNEEEDDEEEKKEEA